VILLPETGSETVNAVRLELLSQMIPHASFGGPARRRECLFDSSEQEIRELEALVGVVSGASVLYSRDCRRAASVTVGWLKPLT